MPGFPTTGMLMFLSYQVLGVICYTGTDNAYIHSLTPGAKYDTKAQEAPERGIQWTQCP